MYDECWYTKVRSSNSMRKTAGVLNSFLYSPSSFLSTLCECQCQMHCWTSYWARVPYLCVILTTNSKAAFRQETDSTHMLSQMGNQRAELLVHEIRFSSAVKLLKMIQDGSEPADRWMCRVLFWFVVDDSSMNGQLSCCARSRFQMNLGSLDFLFTAPALCIFRNTLWLHQWFSCFGGNPGSCIWMSIG